MLAYRALRSLIHTNKGKTKNMNRPVSFILLRKLEMLLFVSDNYDKGKNGILNRGWTILEINLDKFM